MLRDMLTFQEVRDLQQMLTVALYEFSLYPLTGDTVDEALLKTACEHNKENLSSTCKKLLTLLER